MKFQTFVYCSPLCLLAMAMESNAFSGYVTSRNQYFPSGATVGTAPRGSSRSALALQAAHVSFSGTATSKYPLFVASSDGMNPRQERPSLRQKLQTALLLLSHWVSQLARKVRLPLAVLMSAWMLNFGGLSPLPAHAARATATPTKAAPSRPQKRPKQQQKASETEKSTSSSKDRNMKRAVIALGFGASLYSVTTNRKRGFGQAQQTDGEAPPMKVVEKLTLEDLEDLEHLEHEKTMEVLTTDVEIEESIAITSEAEFPLTSNDDDDVDDDEIVAKKKKEEDNPIIEFLDAVGANPEVVYGFLGSSLSFMASENLLISGITFAWIFKLFKESEASDFTDDDNGDQDDEEGVTAEIEADDEEEVIAKIEEETEEVIAEIKEEKVEETVIETEAVVEENKSHVVLEDYRPEELMAEASSIAEESPQVPEEIPTEITEEVVAETSTKIEEIEVTNDSSDEAEEEKEEEVIPNQETIEEVVAEEASEPLVHEEEEEEVISDQIEIEEVVAEETTEPIVKEEEEEEEIIANQATTIEEAVAEETAEPIVIEEEEEIIPDQIEIEEIVAEMTTEPIVLGKEEETIPNQEEIEDSVPEAKMSLGDRAYKVVVDLGLIEWDIKKREKK
ncbi:unnamed protein product [Cylindrotheca closterium]|uniref:Uncharacterized protein n=1 Tax=Cylindrotheca closterium TaxID=2856 RepID=A0AAD2JML8_9STRA|nr:unnamed protein product [Cylindrotheca closterium]